MHRFPSAPPSGRIRRITGSLGSCSSLTGSVFVKVMVMDLMTSSYKGTWMNSDLWRFTPGDLSLDLCQDKINL